MKPQINADTRRYTQIKSIIQIQEDSSENVLHPVLLDALAK